MNLTWLQKHERLILGVLLLAVTLFSINKYINYESQQADARLQSAQAVLQTQKEANDKLAAQNQQAAEQYQVLAGQLNQQNTRLNSEILQLSQSLAARQKQDATLALPDLAIRWQTLLSLPQNSITPESNGLGVSSDAARATVSNLESLPVLKQQLSDETTTVENKDKQLTSITTFVSGLNDQVNGLKLQLTDSDRVCTAKLDEQKKAARKSKRNWFIGGVLTGAGIVAKLLL